MEDRYCEYEKQDKLFSELYQVISDNRQFFASGKKSIHSNFFDTFERILNVLEPLKETLEHLRDVCAEFDLAEDIKGNGFRSLICITEKCMKRILEVGIYIQKNRDRFFFRSYHFYMEIESFAQVISRLFTVIQLSLSVRTFLEDGSLFPDEDIYSEELDGLMDDFETIGRECFYGRSFGFQFSAALQQSLHVIAVAMAAYGDGFKHHNGSTARALSSVLHSGKYVIDPELRAKRIVELTKHVNMPFCKAFWSLTENHGIQHVPMLICPNLAINREIIIEVKPLQIPVANGVKTIHPLFAASKPKIISTRLLSYSHREGQGKAGSTDSLAEALGRKTHGLSKNLVLHCHGGGFVAQSSKSHEIYLRNWAKELDCPILSIDYSLSPESPYPEALNECFYVYAWTLMNARILGTTAERICLTGDSAGTSLRSTSYVSLRSSDELRIANDDMGPQGGNLMVAVTLKAIDAGIRIPNGLSIAYPPMRVQYMASPSRLLSLMDPLLPPGILKVCLRAYAGDVHEASKPEDTVSCKSLRSFENSYNAFDVDLGDASFLARRNSCINVTGKRSYSDSNLVVNGQYSTRLQKLNNLRRKNSLIGEASRIPIVMERHTEIDDEGLLMHPIEPALVAERMQQCGAEKDDEPINDFETHNIPVTCKSTDMGCSILDNNRNNFDNVESSPLGAKKQENCSFVNIDSDCLDNDYRNHKSITNSINEQCTVEGARKDEETSEDSINDGVGNLHIQLRDNFSRNLSHHRRSLSDSVAERFQRLRSQSEDFGETRVDKDKDPIHENPINQNGPILNDLEVPQRLKKHQETSAKTELSAFFNKENDDCIILGKANTEVSASSSFCELDLQSDDTGSERKTSSSDSITSSIKRRSRDPFMSPLLAPDDFLLKMPMVLTVACTLDPLLDDAIEFTRKLKKLGKNAEIFIVDDLPHGFLNLNFASSEAKDASDLLVACIKRILKIGIKHENSFPVSPDAMLSDSNKN